MRQIKKIVVHCSLSEWGNAAVIDKWHKERGWAGIGYHYVILNGVITSRSEYSFDVDGKIERGRPEELAGAHVLNMNRNTIGVVLIGDAEFTSAQMHTLSLLLFHLCNKYSLSIEDIIGHYETPTGKAQGKTCPNIDMSEYRETLAGIFEALSSAGTPVDIMSLF